jgi:subtilisin family serine protease
VQERAALAVELRLLSGWRRALAILSCASLLLVGAAGVAHAGQALDDGKDGPGAEWQAGRIMVRFANAVDAGERERIAGTAGVELLEELPVVPNLWEVHTQGKVAAALERLNSERGVDYAQPDYLTDQQLDAAPDQQAYWPSDPYFWPSGFFDPDDCGGSFGMFGWPYWPLGVDLTDRTAVGNRFNPVSPDLQVFFDLRRHSEFTSYRSINVMPVWNLLKGQHRLDGPGPGGWTSQDLERFAVAVRDTGLSPHPDLIRQVAALFSAVRSEELEGSQPATRDRVREIYRDNPNRNDIAKLKFSNRTKVQLLDRPLFTLDDSAVLEPDEWRPVDETDKKTPLPPAGCDGHGTGVASVAGATTNNGVGVAGTGYNVPIVGLRIGMPWDRPQFPYVTNNTIPDAIESWKQWRAGAISTDQNLIQQYAIVEQLKLPVLNMSYSGPMLWSLYDASDTARPVVRSPALVEALARTLSTGHTLGVATAGNRRTHFGRGRGAHGIDLKALDQPCALKLIPKLGVWTSKSLTDRGPRPTPGTLADEPFKLEGVDWDGVQLLCVAATKSIASKLADFSGRGDAAVTLAAPGAQISIANRPSQSDPENRGAYQVADGTSFAAPMVAGAAALLRRAAPGAPIEEIRRALERGAIQSQNLRGKVRYGNLDVGCALRALNARAQPSWNMVAISPQADLDAYRDFIESTACRERRPEVRRFQLAVSSDIFDREDGERHPTFQSFIDSAKLSDAAPSPSLGWQARLARLAETTWNGGRAAFPIADGEPAPVVPPARPVYAAGLLSVGCSDPGYHMTALRLYFPQSITPKGWIFPTDGLPAPPGKEVQLAVGLAKPWYAALLPATIRIRAMVRCEFFPGLP